MTEAFQELIDDAVRRRHDMIEAMVEQMLVLPGYRGVLVTDKPLGACVVELSLDVPFGEIHYRTENP